jgi:prophage regulatory protein
MQLSQPAPSPRILRLPQLIAKVGLRRDSIYRLAREGLFPKPIKLSENASGWLESEVDAFIERKAAERDQAPLRPAADTESEVTRIAVPGNPVKKTATDQGRKRSA